MRVTIPNLVAAFAHRMAAPFLFGRSPSGLPLVPQVVAVERLVAARLADILTAPFFLRGRPAFNPIEPSSFTVVERTALVVALAAPILLLLRPSIFRAFVAVVCLLATFSRVLTAPLLLSFMPTFLPIGPAGCAVVKVGRRGVGLAPFSLVEAAPGLLVHAPASLPICISGSTVVRSFRAALALSLATPRALVDGPTCLPVRPAGVAVELVVVTTQVFGGAAAPADGALVHHLRVGGHARLIVMHQPVNSISTGRALVFVIAHCIATSVDWFRRRWRLRLWRTSLAVVLATPYLLRYAPPFLPV
mmetsp:Transcript_18362/g.52556  ORF Transcript_18362/g.52556 Transcript_18362/m.52556 type:complete len:304 (+) Transcript_18362:503-1414(+)